MFNCVFRVVVIVDSQWALATMLFVVVVGLQAPPIFAYVMLLFFPLITAPLIVAKLTKPQH